MRAIDTNIVVRFLANDHPQQSARARAIVTAGDVYVSSTVLLETEWVLRSAYDFGAGPVLAALEAFAGLPGVVLEDPDLLSLALGLAREGLDFADALHLGRSADCDDFVTFDRKLVKAAKGLDGVVAVLA
ncbi:MAG: VapC toxin family PIN domain ribonuclease [Sphingomonadales bacterium 32-68-7]|nr:MAG: VapC toxin family PIN domain ribonuclease [Sphingomonadales bacterium 12-68-11]OYX10586.1 MAG: VapC toxin family PIN domain ribonuclease [Sphingomonadales bacterium 32-68-7]